MNNDTTEYTPKLKKMVKTIKAHLDRERRVFLNHEGYEVKKDGDTYIIHHPANGYTIGLEWLDGSGCNLNEDDKIITCFGDSVIHVGEKEVAEFMKPERDETGFQGYIEVVTLNGDWVSGIGVWFDKNKRLVDYDGIYDLLDYPEAIKATRKAGFRIPKDMLPTFDED